MASVGNRDFLVHLRLSAVCVHETYVQLSFALVRAEDPRVSRL